MRQQERGGGQATEASAEDSHCQNSAGSEARAGRESGTEDLGGGGGGKVDEGSYLRCWRVEAVAGEEPDVGAWARGYGATA